MASVAAAADRSLVAAREIGAGAIPLVAVPFMGEVGRRRCRQAEVCWLDLSGNAHMVAPGLRVLVEGRPNRFKRRGRPANAFAPKSARIARWLLLHPHRVMSQREIARATDMDEGFTSRIVAKLESDRLVRRPRGGGVQVSDPGLLLDAWREVYDFSKHHVRRGHVPARSGDALLRQLSRAFVREGIEHAATGLGAAWLLARFATFRVVTLYLRQEPAPQLLEKASFHEEPRGANVWLVLPNDDGIFHGSAERDGIRCVHPVQVYLDLQDHPERAGDAARQLRADLLKWRDDG
ncbi:MAG: type IV toxin-antitoxin system AbiEi family antitoxin [Planctomycetota bacterium]